MNQKYPNSYPTQQAGDMRTGANPLDPEQQLRQEVLTDLVAEAQGSVGLYMSLDLSPSDRSSLTSTIRARNPTDQQAGSTINLRGGWGQYGERALPASEVRTTASGGVDQASFIELEDANVEVRYEFTSQGYLDGTQRPGNYLTAGFVLPSDKAARLFGMVQQDPSFINDVVRTQIIGMGMPEATYDRIIKPRYGFQDFIPEQKRTLNVVARPLAGPEMTSKLLYANKKSLLPQELPATNNPSEASVATAEVENESALVEVEVNIQRQNVQSMLDEGMAPPEILEWLNETASDYNVSMLRAKPGTESDYRHGKVACDTVYTELMVRVLKDQSKPEEDRQNFLVSTVDKLMDTYLAATIDSGVSIDAVPNPYYEIPATTSIRDVTTYNLALVSEACSVAYGRGLNADDFQGALAGAKWRRNSAAVDRISSSAMGAS